MPDNVGSSRSELAKAESTVQELEAKAEQMKVLLEERKLERIRLQTQIQDAAAAGDVDKLMSLQSRTSKAERTIEEMKAAEAESAERIAAARRYLYTLYIRLENLRQEAATLRRRFNRASQALTVLPEERTALRRLQMQIEAITGAE